jgi:hypothetical protein
MYLVDSCHECVDVVIWDKSDGNTGDLAQRLGQLVSVQARTGLCNDQLKLSLGTGGFQELFHNLGVTICKNALVCMNVFLGALANYGHVIDLKEA